MTNFEDRAEKFWSDIEGIVKLLNASNPKQQIQSLVSPTITNYLLWRILDEVKKSNTKETKEKNAISTI